MTSEHATGLHTAVEQEFASIRLPPVAGPLPNLARSMQWEELDTSSALARVDHPKVADGTVVPLRIELGRTRLCRDEVAKLRTGSLLPLDNLACDPVAIYAAGQLVARGEALVLDGMLGVRVTEVISTVGGNPGMAPI
jgi:flagellar motor switch/type III secretory pathway protein FliN